LMGGDPETVAEELEEVVKFEIRLANVWFFLFFEKWREIWIIIKTRVSRPF
jgi:hypothetical protein